ncbi:hypothetical protein EYB25_001240 [Talaromyces marneffei]|nr:hypothetical protein EYB25_001240 [Talaromyces marneffei]
MILRLISQFGILRVVRADDILMIIAWIFEAAKTATSTIAIYWGLGRHDWQLFSEHNFENVMRFEMYSMTFGTISGMFGRVSFAVFLLFFIQRVSRPQTYFVWSIIVVQVVINVLFLAFTLAQCAPSVKGAWAAGMCQTSRSTLAVQYVQGAINATSNICLTFLAVSLILQIRASGYAKASLAILLSLSLIATVAEIVDTVEVSQTRNEGSDFAYRLNTWNYWYAMENAVIIITASMPKIRPIVLVAYQRLKEFRIWRKCTSRGRLDFLTKMHNRNTTTVPLPFIPGRGILVADDCKDSSILPRLEPNPSNNSTYSKESKPTITQSCSHRSGQSYKGKGHSRYFSSISGNSRFSLGPRSPTTTAASGLDSIDLANLDQQQLAADLVPVSAYRLTYQTVITAGDPQPSQAPSSATSTQMPQPPPSAVTSIASLPPPNGSGRSSRNSIRRDGVDGFTTTNSSLIFLPITNNNPSSSGTRGGGRRSNRHNRNAASGQLPILQTSHFTIEYEDDINSAYGDDTINQQQQQHDLGLVWADADARQINMTGDRMYNEDDADALQLHDVGCILDDSPSRRNQS